MPARFTKFVKALVESGTDIMYGATSENEAVENLSDEDLMFMEILNKPKAKSTIVNAIKKEYLWRRTSWSGKKSNSYG